jgi:hypothetical protein
MSKPTTRSGDLPQDTPEGVIPRQLLLGLYRAHEPTFDEHLWPWETQRWHELVFCILTTVAKPEVSPEAIREVTRVLGWANLLDIEVLGDSNPTDSEEKASDHILIAIETVLLNTGFTSAEAQVATRSICEAARGFKQQFEGKVQKFLRHCGSLILDQVKENFSFSQLSAAEATRAFSLWFQNTLNMPLPTPDPISDEACELLHMDYASLVKAADEVDANVALLDNVLRAYWLQKIEAGTEDHHSDSSEEG